MAYDDNNVFAQILRGQIPSKKVYEDDHALAFHDIHPAAPVHVLIVPKTHFASLEEAQPAHQALLGKMLLLAPKLAQEQGARNGFKTVINTGRDGGQEIGHLHVHVLGGPRPWKG